MVNFHRLQNLPSIHATDMTNHIVKRLRNRPSLALWVGANEITAQGRIVEVIGRRVLELDGTRVFRRSSPYGGDNHHHIYWTQEPLIKHYELAKKPSAFTEFGMSSPANMETWKRVLPEEEWNAWPPVGDSVFVQHMPTFRPFHVQLSERFAREFAACTNLPSFVRGLQIVQSLADKFMIEGLRARKPETTMVQVYKLTENYPSASWAVIDYYGVPKRSYYTLREDFSPVRILATLETWDTIDGRLPMSIFAVNETSEAIQGDAEVTLYDGRLEAIKTECHAVAVSTDASTRIADLDFRIPDNTEKPLFVRMDLKTSAGNLVDRNWYCFDFVAEQGSLFTRPHTTLAGELVRLDDGLSLRVENTGALPAISVEFDLGKASASYYCEDMCFWLEPGEERTIKLFKTHAVDGQEDPLESIKVGAWNSETIEVATGFKGIEPWLRIIP